MLRSVILSVAHNPTLQRWATSASARAITQRFVAGSTTGDALRATRTLLDQQLHVSLDFLGEDATSRDEVENTVQAYRELLTALGDADYTPEAEVSVKLSALGASIDAQYARDNAAVICEAASDTGTTLTIDMEEHTTVDATLETVKQLRKEFSTVGAVLQAQLHRTLDDCAELAYPGSRVRLCKGAYAEPSNVAYRSWKDIAISFVRCANTLLAADGYPMFATHDTRLIDICRHRAEQYERAIDSFEFQLLYGVRENMQRTLANSGHTVRVYVPYGTQWYPYLTRRLAEKPSHVGMFLRALISR